MSQSSCFEAPSGSPACRSLKLIYISLNSRISLRCGSEIVKQDGVIDGLALAALIENAKAAAMVSSEESQPGEGDYQRALSFIQEQLPVMDARKKKLRKT